MFSRSPRWPNAKQYLELTEQDFLAALRTRSADTPEKVRYIRIRAWWTANDPLRPDRRQGTDSLSAAARANMESLLVSLSESEEQQRVMKAELARELGRFDEAERLLSGVYSEQR